MSPQPPDPRVFPALLMYDLGLTRDHADVIATHGAWVSESQARITVSALRADGLQDDEIAAWTTAGVWGYGDVRKWVEGGYSVDQAAIVVDWYRKHIDTTNRDILTTVPTGGAPVDLVLLAISAGPKSGTELLNWVEQAQTDDDFTQRLVMMADLEAGQPDPMD